jgi:hypothetical protein
MFKQQRGDLTPRVAMSHDAMEQDELGGIQAPGLMPVKRMRLVDVVGTVDGAPR